MSICIHSICSVCAVRSAFCVLLMPTVLLLVFNMLLPSVAALHFGRCGIVRPTSGIGLPFLALSLRLLFFRGIVFVLDFFTELLFNHLGKGQDFCNIGSAEQKIVIFMHRIHGYYRTYLPADDGKRKQIKKKSKSDLEKVVIDYWTKRSPTSFKERYAVWVDRQKLKGVSDNTIYKYQTDYARFLKGKKIEKRDVRTIDEEYLELFFNELLSEKEVPYRALKALFGYLKGVFDKSIRDGLIESNPCLKIDLPLYKRRCEQAIVKMPEERTFSQSEKNRLINSLNKKRKERPDDVLPYAVELALYTGMRVGELSGLMWNDIDEVNKRILIRHSEKLNRLTNTFYISTPKNGKTRIFPLTIEIAELLKKIKMSRKNTAI